jgi:hypothetical protein
VNWLAALARRGGRYPVGVPAIGFSVDEDLDAPGRGFALLGHRQEEQ